MNCLLCQREISCQLQFHELFLLRQPLQNLCQRCLADFQFISDKHCPRCYQSTDGSICADCERWENEENFIVQHEAIFCYNTAMQDFFSNYKFRGDYRLRTAFAPYFKKINNFTLVPIPVSADRFQERGFNQVTAFLDAAKIPYQDILEKSDTVKQSSLTRAERLQTKNAFSIKKDAVLPRKICLVDDIYTTGATLHHAAMLLSAAGATEIKSFSLCR